MKVVHDHHAGRSTITDTRDVLAIVNGTARGITAAETAILLYGNPTPDRNAVEKARRQLDTLARAGRVHKIEGRKGGTEGGEPTRYCPISTRTDAL